MRQYPLKSRGRVTEETSMLRLRHRTFALLLAMPLVGLAADYPCPEVVELTAEGQGVLLDAPERVMNQAPSVELGKAIRVGTIESVKVDSITKNVTEEVAERIGSDTLTTYQGWIRYTPVVVSDSRLYRPIVLCVSQSKEVEWNHCQDHSWTRVQTATMERSIRLDGKMSDALVEEALAFIDHLGLTSKRDNSTITANSIHHIVGTEYEIFGIRLFSKTQVEGYWDTIELGHTLDSSGASVFELAEFKSGQ